MTFQSRINLVLIFNKYIIVTVNDNYWFLVFQYCVFLLLKIIISFDYLNFYI